MSLIKWINILYSLQYWTPIKGRVIKRPGKVWGENRRWIEIWNEQTYFFLLLEPKSIAPKSWQGFGRVPSSAKLTLPSPNTYTGMVMATYCENFVSFSNINISCKYWQQSIFTRNIYVKITTKFFTISSHHHRSICVMGRKCQFARTRNSAIHLWAAWE